MCNNNCCMCCQCDNTHDEDTPQEITYTSVCDSESCKRDFCKCCCCKKKDMCEDDPNIRLDGMEERMEECCDEVNSRITELECDLAEEIERSTGKDKEHDDKIADLYYKESLDFNKAVFNPTTQKIEFWHQFLNEDGTPSGKDPIHYTEWDIDASNFLKDWFIDDVKLISNRYLELTFNVDPATSTHHEPIKITIDLYDFIDPGLYYTKTEIDGKVATINNNITDVLNSLNAFKTTVANTYETKVAAGNHLNNVDYDPNDHHTLIFTKENGQTITKTIPDADLYIQSGEYTGGNLVLTRNNNTTVTIPVPATNHIVGGRIDNNVITLTRENNGTPVTIQLPADANTYPVSGVVNGNTLTITNSDNSTVPITLPSWSTTDNDHYVTSGTLDGNTLKLTRTGVAGTVDIDLSGVSGTTNVTYGGQSVTIQAAIDAIVNRLAALESDDLWYLDTTVTPNRVRTKSSRPAAADGFYDMTVS